MPKPKSVSIQFNNINTSVRSAQERSAGTVTARDTSALMREGSLCMIREEPSNARHVALGF